MPHIPHSATRDAHILTFEEAMEGKSTAYDREKWIYVPDFYSEYRYILGTRGKNPLIAVGINPSTAEPDNLDNTLKSVERIAHSNGYDSFIMFNVYAQRATDPDLMEKEFNPELHRENMKAFDYILSLSERPSIWAAWGTIIKKRKYLPVMRRRHDKARGRASCEVVHGGSEVEVGRASASSAVSAQRHSAGRV